MNGAARRGFEIYGLVTALGFLITVAAGMFWVVSVFYKLMLAFCCVALACDGVV